MFWAVGPRSSVQCSPAKPDYSIPYYFNPYWTIQPHTTGLSNSTHTRNTCQVHTTYIHTHIHMQTHTYIHTHTHPSHFSKQEVDCIYFLSLENIHWRAEETCNNPSAGLIVSNDLFDISMTTNTRLVNTMQPV